jgi:methionyl-tRNA formyltransferase
MKIVFFGTSEVGLPIIEALHKQHEIIQVVTSPDALVGRKQVLTASPIAQYAMQNNLPLQKLDRVKNNSDFLDFLENLAADIFIVVSYGKILPAELLDIPPLKTVNIHFSLLPKYRGAAPIQFALLEGETQTGTTIFVLDAAVDHGPILAQEKIAIAPNDNFKTLAEKLANLSAQLIIKILPDYQSGKLVPKEQDHQAATATKLITKDDGKVNWHFPASRIYNQYRAFISWPGTWAKWEDRIIKIIDCRPATSLEETEPGNINDNLVTCGAGSQLELITVQLEGGTPTPIKDFIRGYPEFSRGKLK